MTLDALINFRISFSLRSVTKDVRSSSSLHSSAGTLRRIPQAVGAVATVIYLSPFLHEFATFRLLLVCGNITSPHLRQCEPVNLL